MERNEQRRIVEALILGSPEPIGAARLAEVVPGCKPGEAKDLVNELNTEYQEQDRAFEIWEVAGGYQIRTRAEFSGYLQQLQKQRPLRLSRAALDTLSIIAYKQPATRAEIEDIRGVDGGAVLKGLLDRRLIRIAGHREVPGRPMLYATTRRFLEVFGLESLKGLPSLRELKELADQKGVSLPGLDGDDDEETPLAPEEGPAQEALALDGQPDATPESEADAPRAVAETDPVAESLTDELPEGGGALAELPRDALSQEAGASNEDDWEPSETDEDWEPPEIVDPESGTER